jgi:hypothetical protein
MLNKIRDLVLNLKGINKINMIITQELEELEYEEKENFILFLKKQYEEFKNDSINQIKNNEKEANLKDESFTKNLSSNDHAKKDEKKADQGETKTSNNKDEETKNNLTDNNKNKNALILPRKNYLNWILGAGITGLIGIGFFFIFSKKKY